MAKAQKTIDIHVCDLCNSEADVSVCVHCRRELCGECAWAIKCGPFGYMRQASGVVCATCLEHLRSSLSVFGFKDSGYVRI